MKYTKKKASAGNAGLNRKLTSAPSVARAAPQAHAAPLGGVNLQAAQRFLRALTAEDQPVVTFQTFDDNKERKAASLVKVLHGSLDQHADTLAALNQRGAGVFVMVNDGDRKGRSKANVKRVRALFVDFDKQGGLDKLKAAPVKPHIVIESSPGLFHAYWRTDDCSLDAFENLQKALIKHFDSDPNPHDLPRVLRVPGFLHRKRTPWVSRLRHVAKQMRPYKVAELQHALHLSTAEAPHDLPSEAHKLPPELPEIRRALAVLSADDRKRWVDVGQAMRHSYGENGYDDWLAWSQKSEKYQPGDEDKWHTFNRNINGKKLTAWSIIKWAVDTRKYAYTPEFASQVPTVGTRQIVLEDMGELLERDLPEPQVFVPKLLTEGVTLAIGRMKLGKSYLMLQLTKALATGGTFWGRKVRKTKVLYLALEDNPKRMRARLKKLQITADELRNVATISYTAPLINADLPAKLTELIDTHGYGVVIIDTLAAVSSENKGDIWKRQYEAIAALQGITKSKCVAIIIVTHTKKGGDYEAAHDAIAGTGGTTAAADTLWTFQRPRGYASHEVKLTVEGRDFEGGEYKLHKPGRGGGAWQMLGAAEFVALSENQQAIVEALKQHGQPMSWKELKDEAGIGASFDTTLKRLLDDERSVEKRKDGRYQLLDLSDVLGA